MNRASDPRGRRALTAVTIALGLASGALQAQSGAAAAPSAREQALEARVAALEQALAALMAERADAAPDAAVSANAAPSAAAPSTVTAPPTVAAVAAKPPVAAPAAPIQSTAINSTGLPGTRFSFGGFIKLESLATRTDGGEMPDGSAGRLLYLPGAIPVGAPDEGVDLDASAQFSRFWFASDSSLDDGTALRAYLEFDLFGSALGNQVNTNTYGVTVRHAYASWGAWMAGQNWSNFQDPASLVDSIDLIGATDASVFSRQAQVRYTRGAWALALENPETTVGAFRGGGARIASDDNRLPDLTARWTHKGDWGHVSVAGLLRELRHETTTGIDDATAGYGLSITGRRALGASDDLRFGLTAGRGIGRYIGLGIVPDAVLDAGGQLDAIGVVAGFAGLRHVFHPRLRGNLYGSLARFDHDVASSGAGATEQVGSIAANLIYTPVPKLDVGAEFRLGRRWLENGTEGDLARLHLHVKYAF